MKISATEVQEVIMDAETRAFRNKIGMSQAELAPILGVNKGRISLSELRMRFLPDATYERLRQLTSLIETTSALDHETVVGAVASADIYIKESLEKELEIKAIQLQRAEQKLADMVLAFDRAGKQLAFLCGEMGATRPVTRYYGLLNKQYDVALKAYLANRPLQQQLVGVRINLLRSEIEQLTLLIN